MYARMYIYIYTYTYKRVTGSRTGMILTMICTMKSRRLLSVPLGPFPGIRSDHARKWRSFVIEEKRKSRCRGRPVSPRGEKSVTDAFRVRAWILRGVDIRGYRDRDGSRCWSIGSPSKLILLVRSVRFVANVTGAQNGCRSRCYRCWSRKPRAERIREKTRE